MRQVVLLLWLGSSLASCQQKVTTGLRLAPASRAMGATFINPLLPDDSPDFGQLAPIGTALPRPGSE